MVDMLFFAGEGRLQRQELGVDIGAVEGGALLGQITDISALDAIFVHQARDLDAGHCRQVGNQPIVEHIAADGDGIIGGDGLMI